MAPSSGLAFFPWAQSPANILRRERMTVKTTAQCRAKPESARPPRCKCLAPCFGLLGGLAIPLAGVSDLGAAPRIRARGTTYQRLGLSKTLVCGSGAWVEPVRPALYRLDR